MEARTHKVSSTVVLIAFGLMLTTVSPRAQGKVTTPSDSTPAIAKNTFEEEFSSLTSPQLIEGWSRARFFAKDYDSLEKAANQWRTSKAAMLGVWNLSYFYSGISEMPEDVKFHSVWLSNAREWIKKMPESITARVLLAQILTSYAWRARGSGFADTVDEKEFQLFQERLEQSLQVLRDARKLKAKCPHWWSVVQTVALGQGWDASKYKWLYEQAIGFEPSYFTYYANKVYFLAPRWYGEEGEAEKYSLQAANKMGGEQGDKLYGLLLLRMYSRDAERMSFEYVPFEKADKGVAQIIKAQPWDFSSRIMWARLCMVTGNSKNEAARKTRARELFVEMDKLWPDKSASWRKGLEDVRKWAAT